MTPNDQVVICNMQIYMTKFVTTRRIIRDCEQLDEALVFYFQSSGPIPGVRHKPGFKWPASRLTEVNQASQSVNAAGAGLWRALGQAARVPPGVAQVR
jgi:hypothetical protein